MSTTVVPTTEEAINNKLKTLIAGQDKLLAGQSYTNDLLRSCWTSSVRRTGYWMID